MKIMKSELKNMIKEVLREELSKNFLKEELDLVGQELKKISDYEIEYEGFDEDWYRDKWNYSSDRHDQDSGTYRFNDFTYKVAAVDLFEFLIDFLQKKAEEPITSALMTEYKKLMDAWYNSEEGEEEARTSEALDLYTVRNLHELAELYYDDVKEYFSDQAHEWAKEYLDPVDDEYYY